jgi:trimeric autotransporter adhesin
MAATGYTPLLIYASGTTSNTPSASNLTTGSSGAELAINYVDGKLFYKDGSGVVQTIASKASVAGTVSSVSWTGGIVSVATSTSTPALTIAGTSGGIPYFSSASTWASSGALTANALVLGGGAGTSPTVLGSLGTTTTVLHGNSSGAPTFGAVALGSDVSGTLPLGNGGTGLNSFTAGDLVYFASGTSFTKLGIGTNGQVLTSSGTAPQWTTAVASGVTSFQTSMAGLTPSSATTGSVTLAGTLGPANGGTGVANNALSTLTISGNYATTLTVSATTSITLPTSGTLATLTGTETLTNKTLTTPVISSISNSGTLTLPTSTDTLIGRATTDTLTNKTLTNPTITNYTETLQAVGTVGASSTLALTNGTVLTATLTASTPCTFTMPTATAGKSFILILTQASSGMTTATFTGVKWPAGTAPTITATASAVDILSFVANGTSWYGTASQAFA